MIQSGKFPAVSTTKGRVEKLDTSADYVQHLLSYVNLKALR